jgi:hypothetical protein
MAMMTEYRSGAPSALAPVPSGSGKGFELGFLIDVARREGLVGAAERPLDILLEITVEDGEGAGEPGEVLLRDVEEDAVLERDDKTGSERRADQQAFAEMVSGAAPSRNARPSPDCRWSA